MKHGLLLFCFSTFLSFGQENGIVNSAELDILEFQTDSLSKKIRQERGKVNDSIIVDYYLQLSDLNRSNKAYYPAIKYCDTILEKYKSIGFFKLSEVEEKRALLYKAMGKTDVAMASLLKILTAYDKRKAYKESAALNLRIGVIFLKMDELKSAEYHLMESIKLSSQIGDAELEASGLMSLGNRFKKEENFVKAEKYYKQSIDICEEHDFKKLLAGNYNNYGSLQRMMKNPDRAMHYYLLAVEINKEVKNDLWLSYNYNNLGNIYEERKNYSEALRYYNMSNEIKDKLEDHSGLVMTFQNMASVYGSLGNYREAYKYQKQYSQLKDSLTEVDRLEQTKELAAQFQAEKKEAEIKQLSMQDELNQQSIKSKDERIEYQNFLSWLFGIGIVLVLAIAMILWRSVVQRKKTNLELAVKNRQIDEKNREIIDSINYAKRIQNAILPGKNKISALLPNHSVLYKPKDIISGDFYVCDETNDGIYFGTVDCTGHGVPGAMVSIVASSSFNKTIHEFGLHEPGEILTRLNTEIPKALEANEDGINDGMDMALCLINKEKNRLTFAGAFQNCWLFNQKATFDYRTVTNETFETYDSGENRLLELKGNRKGIGMSAKDDAFRSIQIELKKGDKIMLSTDGFQDQFGGPNNKKFMVKKLREIVLANVHQNHEELMKTLTTSFNNWQGNEDQVDDICVFIIEV